MVNRAERVPIEAITPMAVQALAGRQEHLRLIQANKSLRQRTVDLAAANRALKNEIARHKATEQALKKSEQHYRDLLEQSRHMQEQLRHLSHRLLSAQEDERKEISRELHDEIAQALTGINAHLAALKVENAASTKGLRQRIARTQRLVQRSVNIVHRFARDLRPTMLDDLGLIPALHASMKDFTKRTGVHIRFAAFKGVEQLDSGKRTMLYRVAESALANVAQHAHATRVKVSLQKLPGCVCMEISDDGNGFDVKRVMSAKRRKRLGLLGMRERVEMLGGSFAVESKPGKGTTILARVPLGNGRTG